MACTPFFFLSSGQHAPAIRDALQTAGLEREHALFVRAMALFGPTYPVDNARAKRISATPRSTSRSNEFDHRMMEISRSFGSREAFGEAIVGFVERTPALWQRIEGQRARLGELARLRYLNQALIRSINIWDKPEAEVAAKLAALPTEQRTLFAMEISIPSSRTAACTSSSTIPPARSRPKSTPHSSSWA